jgi:hypothetical protein
LSAARVDSTGEGMAIPYDEKDMDALRIAYAEALWAWNDTEAELFVIYQAATLPPPTYSAALHHSFFTVMSPQARLQMTETAAKTTWKGKPAILDAWAALSRPYRAALTTRGTIAHLCGMPVPLKHDATKFKCVLAEPPVHAKSPTTHEEQRSKMGAAQLEEMARDWKKLEKDLKAFSDQFYLPHMSPAQRAAYLAP